MTESQEHPWTDPKAALQGGRRCPLGLPDDLNRGLEHLVIFTSIRNTYTLLLDLLFDGRLVTWRALLFDVLNDCVEFLIQGHRALRPDQSTAPR